MLEAEYATMFAAEEGHWWYRGLHDQARRAVGLCREAAKGPLRVLDAGCGTGKVLDTLARDGDVKAFGLDLSATALDLARRRGPLALTRASAAALPFADASFDAVLSLDVLANLPPRLLPTALADCRRVLVPGGRLICNIVAFQALYSEHDRAVGVVRRYTRGQLARLLAGAGFVTERLTYANTLLFPAAALVRLARRRPRPGQAPRSDLAPPPAAVNTVLAAVRRLENILTVDLGIPLPVGLSIFAVARNPPQRKTGRAPR
ncbi:MAG: class I SAM-dependent methyltransferase [Solidesulfovibrio sp. DCME]|uniref:class I SAM-dependent methyltransferase n=1 Tax=Solidesulfovibrio sp. DCME TaxID=3447380 RepID=UPI003D12D891